jgi:ketosteroid isomerase-like protein
MKKLFFLIAFPLVINACFAQSGDRAQILKVLSDQTTAWNNGDLDKFMAGYLTSDSLMMIGKSGITYGYQNILDNYKRNYTGESQMGKLFFDILEVKRLSAEYYFVVGKWFLKRSAGDVGGHYTLLFRKIKGKWMIVADHSS